MAEIETLFKTESCSVENLRPEILEGCCELWSIAFAKPGRDKNSVMTERLKEINEVDERIKNFSCEEVWHVIWESCEGSNRIVAAARTFSRMMLLSDGTKRSIFGLAHVASHPEKRGLGLGKTLVQAALCRINDSNLKEEEACFLFQSSSPDFYTKLGARVLPSEEYHCINSTGFGSDAKRIAGFWDPAILIYPSNSEIPKGDIDLLGPGY
mmetsp:Transcript_28389/g.33615  ORF Transcript_28389/g.33615 Transcript_28389/m.33615 type:complete len:211 (+) Transcript_28389:15-647(+)